MIAPVWVPMQVVHIIHDRQISRHGGISGLRDGALLASGCNRALDKFSYEKADIFQCAAAYAYGISKAHAFLDGNKRTAFVTCATFLRLNGFAVNPDPIEGVKMMEDLATNDVNEAQFAEWLKNLSTAVK